MNTKQLFGPVMCLLPLIDKTEFIYVKCNSAPFFLWVAVSGGYRSNANVTREVDHEGEIP